MNRRLKRLTALMLGVVMLTPVIGGGFGRSVAGASLSPGGASPSATKLELERCLLTVHFLYEPDGKRFLDQGYVPEGYTPARVANLRGVNGELAARLEFWTFSCEHVRVGNGKVAPAVLGLISIVLEDRPGHEHWAGISDNYLMWAHTNRADIAEALEVRGIPTSSIKAMTFAWRQGPLYPVEGLTTASVPWVASPYSLAARGLVGTNSPHHHDNTFQHFDPARGKASLELQVLLPPGQDLLCLAQDRKPSSGWDGDPACGVKAEPGTELARLLGDDPMTTEFDPTTRTGVAADHDMLWKATLVVNGS